MTIREKAAYLKGLVAGSDLKMGDKEKAVFDSILDLLDEMSKTLSECDEDLTDLYDDVSVIEEEVDMLIDDVYGEDDYDDEDYDDEDYEDDLYEVECPKCHKTFSVDEDTLVGNNVKCPFCGEPIEFDLEGCDRDCESCDVMDCEDRKD